ncbi:hypothetical protein ACSSV4_002280 [Roseovarius sp. MBR-154]|jgi:hypothetical protein
MAERGLTLPSLFIAGAPKSGTSSVFQWVADHPQALGSTPKEPCFFADPGSHVFRPDFNVSCGLELYSTAFAPVPEGVSLILDGTPSYIYSLTALERIPDLPTRPRCLFILREPAAQVYSTYTYFQNNWAAIPDKMSFQDYLHALRQRTHDFSGNELARDALQNAAYVHWLRKWRARLGPDRMKVCTFDALKQDARAFMMDLASWTGLDPAFYETYDFRVENQSYVPRNRSLQRLNIALRDALPKGAIYSLARSLYRRVNTRAPERGGQEETLARLRADFSADNKALSEEFDLDLSRWA